MVDRGEQLWEIVKDAADHMTRSELQARIAALEAQLAERVKVKALEWGDSGCVPDKAWGDARLKQARGHHHLGRYAGSYTIQEIEPGGWWGWWNTWTSDRDPEGVGRTKDDAKAAAQADFDRRILSALEATSPAPKVTDEMVEDCIMPVVRQALADYAHSRRNASVWELEPRILSALTAALSGDAS